MGLFVICIPILPNFLHNGTCVHALNNKKWMIRGVVMVCTEVDELEERINQMRKTLILIAKETGLNSHDTICYSQKLDELITRYQKLKLNNTQEFEYKSYITT